MSENDTLSRRQRRAVLEVLRTPSMSEAAKAAGVSRKTLYRWMEIHAFQMALREAERGIMDDCVRRLAGMSSKALDTLDGLLDDSETPAGVKVRASLGILDARLRLREISLAEQELSELEVTVKEIMGSHG